MLKSKLASRALGAVLALGALALTGCSKDSYSQTVDQALEEKQAQYITALKAETAAIPDPPAALPTSKTGTTELQYMIQLGETLMRETNTHPMTASFIPESGLTCSSCHLDAGKKKAIASTFIGAATAFPAFNDRDGGVITLQDRINSCFMRSMNGIRLPENSEPMLAMVSYITWLSEGFPIRMNADRAVSKHNNSFVNKEIKALAETSGGNAAAGAVLYASECASCHGADGLGIDTDGDSHYENPPVWGPESYNKGAGLANNFKGASWVQFNMPPGKEFTLGNQQALDIMTYINVQPRPAFVENDHLPSGGVRYGAGEIVYHYGRHFSAEERKFRVPAIEEPAQPGPTVDGAALYTDNCADCHGALAASTKKGRTAAQIRQAIDSNIGNMGSLNSLSGEVVQAIAAALAQ